MLRGELFFELFLGVGRAHLGDFGLHVGIHRRQSQFLGALQHDLLRDHAGEQIDLLRHDLVFAGAFGLLCIGLIGLVQFGEGDGVPVHFGRDVGWRRVFARSERESGDTRGKDNKNALHLRELPL